MTKKIADPPRYFTKARVANVLSAYVLIFGLYAFVFVGIETGTSEVVAGIMGFAAKHLWDSCGDK